MKKYLNTILQIGASLLMVMATYNVNVACKAYIGQDEIPEKIKALRKF